MAKDLIGWLGLEGLVTPKTLVNETKSDVERKTPNDMANDIRSLLDELNVRVASKDVDGLVACLAAARLRIDIMTDIAKEFQKPVDKSRKK